jgi:translation initiation factor 2 subunit 3
MINICTLGSVADGKSSMIKMLTGEKTQRDSRELKRNITINAGYANLKIWVCSNCNVKYPSNEHNIEYECLQCNNQCKITKHISFGDCPGHQELIITMMSSVSLMKGAIIIISVETPLKDKPQLRQHLLAAKFAKLEKLIICLNKCDLQNKNIVMERYNELKIILKELNIVPEIIIPTSFTNNCGKKELVESIDRFFNFDIKENNNTLFRITRTFDINKAGTPYTNVQGGCLGGTLISGKLELNDEVEIRPGILTKEKNGRYKNEPIKVKLLSFETNNTKIDQVNPGGLVSIKTSIDPFYCKGNNMLCGNVLGQPDKLPPVYHDINIEYTKINEFNGKWDPKNGDTVFLQIENMSSEARLTKSKGNILTLQLIKPACISDTTQILICRKQPIITIVGLGKLII